LFDEQLKVKTTAVLECRMVVIMHVCSITFQPQGLLINRVSK